MGVQRECTAWKSSNIKSAQLSTQDKLHGSGNESNRQTPVMETNCDGVFESPRKSPTISERFTQPAKMNGTSMSYEFPSPMHAVLIQYDKPLTEAARRDDNCNRIGTNGNTNLNRGCLNKPTKPKVNDEENLTTKFIQKLVRRSSSFKKLKELQLRNEQFKEIKRSRGCIERESCLQNMTDNVATSAIDKNLKQIDTISSKISDTKDGPKQSPVMSNRFTQPAEMNDTNISFDFAKNTEKNIHSGNLQPLPQRGRHSRNSQMPQKKHSTSTRSSPSSRLSMTSSDGGYFSHPNSPQSSLKFGSSRLITEYDTSNILKGQPNITSQNNKYQIRDKDVKVKTELRKCNDIHDVIKTQTKTGQCQRSHSFSGGSNLPLSVFQQRPRSHSTTGPMKPVALLERKTNSLSGPISLPRYASETKLALSISTFMNDVQDTFI